MEYKYLQRQAFARKSCRHVSITKIYSDLNSSAHKCCKAKKKSFYLKDAHWVPYDCFLFVCFSVFMNLTVEIKKKRYNDDNKTHWATDFLNSSSGLFLSLILFIQKIKFHIWYWTKVVLIGLQLFKWGKMCLKKSLPIFEVPNLYHFLL